MKLISIQIFPIDNIGWASDLLLFGNNITQLFGPNGCGKTPVVQSIAYCLGYPCIFRTAIYEHCKHAILNIETDRGIFSIKRIYSRDTDIYVTEPHGENQRFLSELEFSAYIFDLLDLKSQGLVSNSRKSTPPYLSTMLPIFFLDQDDGYSHFYCPPMSFIKDQFSEMIRMIFDLPAKNSFDSKKAKFIAKEKLDYLDKTVQEQSRRVTIAKETVSSISLSSDEIGSEIERLESQIETLKNTGADHDDSIDVLDRLIATHNRSIRNIVDEIAEIQKRTNGINQIVHEINTEIETLNLNEEARRVFLSFKEICNAANCQLFTSSSDSYGKNLLYLKDQIKDLQRNAMSDSSKLVLFEAEKIQLESTIKSIVTDRNNSLEKSEISALVDAISTIMNQIFELQNQRNDIKQVELLETKLFDTIKQRGRALEIVESFSIEKSSNPILVKIKADLRQSFLHWLGVIRTKNISHDITFKDDFTPLLGNETITQLKGSTRIRAVLAYHAALIEIMAKLNRLSFRFLILDTPKQHEIHIDDLDNYIKELKKCCTKHDIQIVFSTTEYHYDGDDEDAEWNPEYPGEDQHMFLSNKPI